ncbi:MAG: acyl-CoA dehydrogenase family protein [Alphaproteobacteria bacterium]|nr:acyl-CoA dehydrogenase family protein [Alphaproteobacteria bacterium]
MDLTLSPADSEFRDRIRAFIRDHLPHDIKEKIDRGLKLEKDDYLRWQRLLHGRGWMAPGWPPEHGGSGWTPTQKYLFDDELGRGSAPRVIPFGVNMVGPVIIAFGSQAQKARFLPRILSSEDWWCQGYSEPGAGSDLASLTTRAVREADHYVVNGSKTWTTLAQWSDWIFCLVRTDSSGKKQEGISFLLIDMKSPGVSVTPIVTMDGGREINQVFFDDVAVPADNLVGEEGKGWTCAKFLLGHERLGTVGLGSSKHRLELVKEIARAERSGGRPLLEERRFRDKVAHTEIELLGLEYTMMRVLADESAGRAPGPEASILKIKGTEMQQAITELVLEAVGYYAYPYVPEALEWGWNEAPIGPEYAAAAAPTYFNWRKASIYGGSNEIQKNIIAKMVLGL